MGSADKSGLILTKLGVIFIKVKKRSCTKLNNIYLNI